MKHGKTDLLRSHLWSISAYTKGLPHQCNHLLDENSMSIQIINHYNPVRSGKIYIEFLNFQGIESILKTIDKLDMSYHSNKGDIVESVTRKVRFSSLNESMSHRHTNDSLVVAEFEVKFSFFDKFLRILWF